jgi:nicotinamidase-related amidase
MTFRNGLASLLRPQDSVLVLIDHQPFQLANLNSHDPQMVVNNSAALAKAAKAFGVPTILTSVIAERGGLLFPQITDVFPGQEVIDRTLINTWEDRKVVDAVKATGRKQLIIAGLYTEICVAMPVIHALGEGWDVTVITDACGAVSVEAHQEVTLPVTMAGLPALSVPAGFGGARNLPIGMQIIGSTHADLAVLQVGHAYERASPWIGQAVPEAIRI